ncbi:hypothetical protein OK49_003782 [Salmonella enterica subsp. enterica]|uniref:Uncharacterized protein n=5 Tax=Salmonella enterica TaxID=28901 RepID=A0A5X0PH96_SALTM|nr:hypothetical protein [Salmonella enterica]AZT35335.1 hypothetical protein EL006_23565 [Salmonella enterica subsp. enterica serovar Stanleyville]EAA5681010.1 hypothetical protein [Salmonella enterica subsp. enterica]EBN0142031.1 hypothetical protein [Salmonella enterica subsp. enterica serovar Typhimurium]EBQ5984486.1 hypothetical protein [Salmonella enterica subsp. houtenae serovar Houten]EBS5459090.1 hypothetical protein [Salmonella enterica subsp. enterica serovar Enteritidis]EBS5543381.
MNENILKVNKGNYSYTITFVKNNISEMLHVVKYVKTRGKHTSGKTKRELVFDKLLSPEQALILDEGVLRERIQKFLNGGNNEE